MIGESFCSAWALGWVKKFKSEQIILIPFICMNVCIPEVSKSNSFFNKVWPPKSDKAIEKTKFNFVVEYPAKLENEFHLEPFSLFFYT